MNIIEILENAVRQKASDIFIIAGRPIIFKINNVFKPMSDRILDSSETEEAVALLYENSQGRDFIRVKTKGDDDFSITIRGLSRFRINVYKQRSSLAAIIRVISFQMPDPDELGIPPIVMKLSHLRRGLVLVTGTAGSGKSTTLACIIDKINRTRHEHIITLEDPLEYLHKHEMSIVSQREIMTDTESYVKALRASLRQAPDVIFLGEMRDHETISVAMTAAETGHLVFSTLHTVGASTTIDRIIDAFPPNQQSQIRIQLSMVLQAVVSQQLVPTVDGKITSAFEIMLVNGAIRNMIRESKIHQIDSVIHSSANDGMITMDTSLLNLFKQHKITNRTALMYSVNQEMLSKRMV